MDENVAEKQRTLLRRWRIPVRQIGHDLGRWSMHDEDVIPLLRRLRRPTFFPLDIDYYQRWLCHHHYCLVWLDIRPHEVARYVRRVLRHRAFDTQAKRMGCVTKASPTGLTVWRLHAADKQELPWET